MKIRYFDNAATTPVKEEVLKEMLPYFEVEYGNPSSIYSLGRKNKKAIENAREKVAKLLNCKTNEIYFTSGGSESDNMAIKGYAYFNKEKGNHIITSKIEHHAILETCENLEKHGFQVTYLNVDQDGVIKLDELVNAINKNTILISIMFANNEIGTIEPIEQIEKIAKEKNIAFHTDGVQACGNIPIDVQKLGIDMLSISGHKIYGPKGIGALYIRDGIKIDKYINGGHQEKNKRAGTENVAGIVGLGKACELANQNINEHMEKLKMLRKYYVSEVQKRIENIKINGAVENRLPGNSNISFKNVDGGELLLRLDNAGICASTGSACNSGITNSSHVLTAIGLPQELSQGALRITFGDTNTKEDVDFLVNELEKNIKDLRNI